MSSTYVSTVVTSNFVIKTADLCPFWKLESRNWPDAKVGSQLKKSQSLAPLQMKSFIPTHYKSGIKLSVYVFLYFNNKDDGILFFFFFNSML